MDIKGKFKYIFFDADDTLWENERYFRAAEAKFIELLADYTTPEGVQDMLSQTTVNGIMWQLLNNNIFNSLILPPIIALFARKKI